MRPVLLTSLWIMMSTISFSQNKITEIPTKNTYPISESDSREDILLKAAHVVPTNNQYRALQDEFIAFIHFGPNTFTRMEWGSGEEDPAIFDLQRLDTDQWVKAMKSAGMRMVILTVKHHDGFVLWQSRYTRHGIMSTGFKEGKGDILKELAASCQKYGMKLGIYLSPADLYQIESPDGLYGNLSKYTTRTIPAAVEGRPFENQTEFQFEVDDYNEYFLNQLFELLTEYGPIHEVWFDGAHPKTKGGQQYNYAAWKELIKTLAPEAVIFGKEDIRWCGNESGGTRDTEWNVLPYQGDPAELINFPDLTLEDLGSREKLWDAKYLHYQQAETNTSIREGWFYRDDTHQKVRSVDDVFDIYERSVGGNTTFLLNIPPNREGRFSEEDVDVLQEVGNRIKETYGQNLLKGATGAVEMLDDRTETYTSLQEGQDELLFSTKNPIKINRFVIQEAIQTHGERIESHALDVWSNDGWKEIATATNVGYKRILRFPDVSGDRFRLRILSSRARPAISQISAHYAPGRPPQLAFQRDLEGNVSIKPFKNEFGWKPHGEDIQKNLHMDYRIHYSLDRSKPTAQSPVYDAPLPFEGGKIRAVAISADQVLGAEAEHTFGLLKKGWNILDRSGEIESNKAKLAIDANEESYWQSEKTGAIQHIALDLGQQYDLSSFSYTPQAQSSEGLMERGVLQVSEDGKNWKEVEHFEFGNLINDPTTRTHHFKEKVATRYVRIESRVIAGDGKSLSIAELDFFE